jgi:hypothetical protein
VRPASPAILGGITPITPPGTGVTTATIVYADRGSSKFKTLRTIKTDSRGYFTFNSKYRAGRRWNIRWTSFSGTPVGPYTKR